MPHGFDHPQHRPATSLLKTSGGGVTIHGDGRGYERYIHIVQTRI